MPPFSQWWHFYFLSSSRITMNSVIAHWWFLLHPNVKREDDQHLGHLLPLTAAWFSVASSHTASCSFWRKKKSKLYISLWLYAPLFPFHTFVSVLAWDKNTSVLKFSTSLCSNQQLLSMKEKLIIFLTNSRKQHFTTLHPWTKKAKGKKLVRKE